MFKSSILACASILAFASVASAATERPMFAVLKPNMAPEAYKPLATPNWNFTWTYNSHNYSVQFIGTTPKAGGTTNVVVHLIPAKFVVGSFTADPSANDTHGMSPVTYSIASPIFDNTTDYKQGSVDLGKTQYEDAFLRLNIWGELKKKKQSGYHVLLTPKLETGLVYNNPSGATVATDFGVKVVNYNINSFDSSIQSTVAKYPAADLVLFITTQLYLTSGGCCIGGYHSYTGSQAYGMYTFIQASSSVFSWDVSAMSHELGEWLDDPETNNSNSPCFYEVGDPLEGGQTGHPYGTWTYALGGVTYHLQDLVTPVYFGAPTKDVANGFWTFQGYTGFTRVCQNGG